MRPGPWISWLTHISTESNQAFNLLPIPLAVRLPLAALLVVYAARTDRAWLLVPAVALSLPLLWVHGLAVLVSITPLVRRRASVARTIDPVPEGTAGP